VKKKSLSLLFSWRVLALLALQFPSASASQPTTAPAWPIEYRHEMREDPKLHLHVVTIDLTDPRVELAAYPCGDDPDGDAGPWQMTLNTVRETAAKRELDAAVNANFFAARDAVNVGGRRVPYFGGNWARASGWLVSDGRIISGERAQATLVVGEDGRVRVGRFERLPAGTRHAVSGSQQIVTAGRLTARGDVRAPRTAVGVSADGAKLVMLVVDGRALWHSVGMSETELGREMIRLGCADAINLDGGGSSTLVLRGPDDEVPRLRSRPSDGHDLRVPLSVERTVACVLDARVRRVGPAATRPALSSTSPTKEQRP